MKTFTPWNGHHNRFLDPLDGPRGVQKTDSYTFFSWFLLSVTSLMFKRLMFVIPSLLYIDFMMTQMPYLTWILDLAIFRRQKYIFCIFYIFNVHYHLRGSFKYTFILVFFFVLKLCFKDLVKKTDFYTFFSWFIVTSNLPNVQKAYVCNPKSALYWLHDESDAIFDLDPGLSNFQKSTNFFWHILYF